MYLKTEKDYEELVQHDYNQIILNNKTSNVTGTHNENILQAHIQNIAGLKDVNVGGEYLTVVALSKDTAVGLSNTLNVGASNKLRVTENSITNDNILDTENELSELSKKDKEFVLKLRKEISDYLFFHILRTSLFAVICIIFVIGYMIIGTIFSKPKDFWTSEKLSFIVSN